MKKINQNLIWETNSQHADPMTGECVRGSSTGRSAAGIEQFILVTERNKGVIEDHFDLPPELERALRIKGKTFELHSRVETLLKRELAASLASKRRWNLACCVVCT